MAILGWGAEKEALDAGSVSGPLRFPKKGMTSERRPSAIGGGTKTHCNLTVTHLYITPSLATVTHHHHHIPHAARSITERASFAIGDARFFHAGSPSARARAARR